MRATLLLAACVLPFAACSGVKTFELGLHGDTTLNPNEDNQPNAVRVRVLRLVGEESARAFREAPFDALWSDPITAGNVVIDSSPLTLYVPPRKERVTVAVKDVPAKVTHFGVLGLFNSPVTGKDRVVIERGNFDALEVWLHDSVIDTRAPSAAATAPAATGKPGS